MEEPKEKPQQRRKMYHLAYTPHIHMPETEDKSRQEQLVRHHRQRNKSGG